MSQVQEESANVLPDKAGHREQAFHRSMGCFFRKVGYNTCVGGQLDRQRISAFNTEEAEILAGNRPVQEKLQMITQSFMRITQGFDSRVYGDLQRFYKADWEKWTSFRQEKVSKFMKLLQEGIDSGAVKPVNFAVVYQCLNTAMEAIAQPDFLESSGLTYSQAVDTLQEIVFHGLLA